MTFKVPEKFRVTTGPRMSSEAYGNNGDFKIKSLKLNRQLNTTASDEEGWEHVSISLPDRCPTWDEMCFIKNLFWDDDDVVIQYHPAKKDYINYHPCCLHLWRPTDQEVPTPPKIFVGI